MTVVSFSQKTLENVYKSCENFSFVQKSIIALKKMHL